MHDSESRVVYFSYLIRSIIVTQGRKYQSSFRRTALFNPSNSSGDLSCRIGKCTRSRSASDTSSKASSAALGSPSLNVALVSVADIFLASWLRWVRNTSLFLRVKDSTLYTVLNDGLWSFSVPSSAFTPDQRGPRVYFPRICILRGLGPWHDIYGSPHVSDLAAQQRSVV